MQGKSGPAQSSTDHSSNPKMNLGAWLRLNQTVTHICPHCSKPFQSSQALGGHQNAHRKEQNKARKLRALERHSYMKNTNILPPKSLRVLPPVDGPNFENVVAPLVNPWPAYGPVSGFHPRLGTGSHRVFRFALELGYGPSSSRHVFEYGFPNMAPCGNHYYHPYLSPGCKISTSSCEKNLIQEMEFTAAAGPVTCSEASSSETAESYANAKASNGGKDCTEVTSKRQMDLSLKLRAIIE